MSKVRPISGFPEWLPEERIIEENLAERTRNIFSSYGFVPIETPAVELMSTLSSKGEVDKEIYVLRRALSESEEEEAELGLHFDLTVPFSRYVAQHFNDLVFPFKRYQMQKSWRGERPQKGRFREFYQCDIDIMARDSLPLSCDAEIVSIIHEIFTALDVVKYTMRVNNRKILKGFYASFGMDEERRSQVIRVVDKLDKIGEEGVASLLRDELKLEPETIEKILRLSTIRLTPQKLSAALEELAIDEPLFHEGKDELARVLELVPEKFLEATEVDLSLARGLDYYTGLILEVLLPDYLEYGSFAGGGRYDDLSSEYINQKLPGVGATFGFTRFMAMALENGLFPAQRQSRTEVLISVLNEEQRKECNALAHEFRAAGMATEVYFSAPKLGKQIQYADKKGMPFVAFLQEDGALEIKDLRSKEQTKIKNIASWASGIKKH